MKAISHQGPRPGWPFRRWRPGWRAAVALLLFILGSPLQAQQSVPMSLVRHEGRDEYVLTIAKLEVTAVLNAAVSETRLDLTFSSGIGWPVEGDLLLPLPAGAAVTGYALDVAGQMVDGVLVERDQTRRAYASIITTDKDLGLCEGVQGNEFRTHIFVIPANGARRVQVRYVEPVLGQAEPTVYRMPLLFARGVGAARLRVEIAGDAELPAVTARNLPNLAFTRQNGKLVADVQMAKLPRDAALELQTRWGRKATDVLLDTGAPETLFAVCHEPPAVDAKVAWRPARVALLWDCSGSRASRDHRREIEFVERWLAAIGGALTVDLVCFRETPEPVRSYEVKAGQCAALLTDLRGIVYDGGTRFGLLPAIVRERKAEAMLLVTDGRPTLEANAALEFGVPVLVLPDGPAADLVWLAGTATINQGTLLDLGKDAVALAMQTLQNEVVACKAVTADGAEVLGVFPPPGSRLSGPVTVIGRLRADQATVHLQYTAGGRELPPVTLPVARAQARSVSGLRTLLGLQRLAELVPFPDRNRAAIEKLGREFSLATPFTSFIFLDSAEHYVQYGIEPPANRPQVLAKYKQEMAARVTPPGKSGRDVLLRAWRDDVQGWAAPPQFPEGFAYRLDLRLPPPAPGAPAGPLETWAFAVRAGTGDAAAPVSPRGDDREAASGARVFPPAGDPATARVTIKEWDPTAPYLAALRAAPPEARYAVYLKWRPEYARSPTFFFDCAEFFFAVGDRATAARVLGNVAELGLSGLVYERRLARTLTQVGQAQAADGVYDRLRYAEFAEQFVLRERAVAVARLGEYERAVGYLLRAIHEYEDAGWISMDFPLLALTDLNGIAATARRAGAAKLTVPAEFLAPVTFDLRVIVTGEPERRSLEIMVVEPSGETASAQHRDTMIGGCLRCKYWPDFAQGLVEYTLPKAAHGKYQIRVRHSAESDSGSPRSGREKFEEEDLDVPDTAAEVGTAGAHEPDVIFLDIYTNYGRPNEKLRQERHVLKGAYGRTTLAEVEF